MRFLYSVFDKLTRRWMEARGEPLVGDDGPEPVVRIGQFQLFLPKAKVRSRMKAKVEDSDPKAFIENPTDKSKYSLIRRIGTGSISSCYEARRTCKDKFVVLKVVDSNTIGSGHQQILNEINHLRQIERHPNVIQFLDNFTDANGRICLVIEHCLHGSLADFLDNGGTLGQHVTANIGRQILKGLSHIHRLNLVHRDLKLGNILLNSDYCIKITDFGLTCPLKDCQSPSAKLCGTPNYLAPEVCQRKGYSFASDIWSFGVCLYTICTGQVPFHVPTEGNNITPNEVISQTMGKIVSGRFSISDAIVPVAARTILVSILVMNPSKRPTLEQLLDSDYFSCICNPLTCNDKEPCRLKNCLRFQTDNKMISSITRHICKGLLSFRGNVQQLVWVKCWGKVTEETLHFVLSNGIHGILEQSPQGTRQLLQREDSHIFHELLEFTQQLELDLRNFYAPNAAESQDPRDTNLCAWHYCLDGSIGFLFDTGAWQVNFVDHVKLLVYRNLAVIVSGNRGSHENLFNWLRVDCNRKYLRPICEIAQVFSSTLVSDE